MHNPCQSRRLPSLCEFGLVRSNFERMAGSLPVIGGVRIRTRALCENAQQLRDGSCRFQSRRREEIGLPSFTRRAHEEKRRLALALRVGRPVA
jgi:hypothetical protein